MRLALIVILILGRVIQTYSQDFELLTKQTENPNSTEKYSVLKSDENVKQGLYEKRQSDNRLVFKGYYSKNKKDSLWVSYASNGIDTASIRRYTEGNPSGLWTIYDDQCRVKYKFDYSKYDVVEYNWYEISNELPIFNDTIWTVSNIDSPPLIIGLERPEQLFYSYLRYPLRAFEKGISGRVLISFTVEKDGTTCDFKVVEGVHRDLDAEALRVVEILEGNLLPARKDGQAITVEYFIGINFVLR